MTIRSGAIRYVLDDGTVVVSAPDEWPDRAEFLAWLDRTTRAVGRDTVGMAVHLVAVAIDPLTDEDGPVVIDWRQKIEDHR